MIDPADPLFATYRSLGVFNAVDAFLQVVGTVRGATILDIGSGDGAFARSLAERGAAVTGLDPLGPAQAPTPAGAGTYRLVRAGAEQLEADDASVDLVTLIFSLHHISLALLPRVLAEARRVLRNGGRLYVAEPVAAGPLQQIATRFHDETGVRREAASILRQQGMALFKNRESFSYLNRRCFANFDAYAGRMLESMRFNDFAEADLLSPAVRTQFGATAEQVNGVFDQPVRIDTFSA